MRRFVSAAAAPALLCACVTQVTLDPRNFAWDVCGSRATWRSEGVTVTVDLVTVLEGEKAELPVTGRIRARGPDVSVSFLSASSAGGAPLGELRSGEERTRIVAGAWYPVPPAGLGGAAAISFALRPNPAWGEDGDVGETVTYELRFRDPARESSCPLRLRIERTRSVPAEAFLLPAAILGIVAVPVVLVLAVLVGGPALAGGGSAGALIGEPVIVPDYVVE